MLPIGNGLNILRKIKDQNNPAGVIIISAKDSLDDKEVQGLKIGADDYLAKPFHLPELNMRIYALVRRRQFSGGNVLHSNGIEIDLLSKEVTAGNKPVILTKTEYDLLLYFIGNKNKVVSKRSVSRTFERRPSRYVR